MRWVVIGVCAVALGGCLQSVTIPAQEASLKEACHGKDRVLASRNGISVYRCGEGDQAKFAAYQNGALFSELNEIAAVDLASVGFCANNGYKRGTPDFETCLRNTRQISMAQGASLRQSENAAAEEKQRQTAAALAAIGAAAGAAATYQPPPQADTVRLQTNCTSSRVGNFVNTNCF